MLDAPDSPRADLEAFFWDRLPTHLAPAIAAIRHMLSSPPHVVEHREQLLVRRHAGETIDRQRRPLADSLTKGDRADLASGFG